jgi:flavodoxin
MKILIVYDSYHGNNTRLGKVIAHELEKENEVQLVHIKDFKIEQLKELDLVFIGTPTRVFRPTKLIIKWIKNLSGSFCKGVKFGLYDTRLDLETVNIKFLFFLQKRRGSAVDTMKKLVEQKNGEIVGNLEAFIVEDSEGPFRTDEFQRAKIWSQGILENLKRSLNNE